MLHRYCRKAIEKTQNIRQVQCADSVIGKWQNYNVQTWFSENNKFTFFQKVIQYILKEILDCYIISIHNFSYNGENILLLSHFLCSEGRFVIQSFNGYKRFNTELWRILRKILLFGGRQLSVLTEAGKLDIWKTSGKSKFFLDFVSDASKNWTCCLPPVAGRVFRKFLVGIIRPLSFTSTVATFQLITGT